MKQQYTFSKLFSFLPFLLAAFLWLGGSSVLAGGTPDLFIPSGLNITGGGTYCEDGVSTQTLTASWSWIECSGSGNGSDIYPEVSYQWYTGSIAPGNEIAGASGTLAIGVGSTSTTYNAPLTPSGSTDYYVEITWTSADTDWTGNCTAPADLGPLSAGPETVTVTSNQIANAGPDQSPGDCSTSFTLAGNAITDGGTGTWTYTGPDSPTFTPNANDPTAVVTGLTTTGVDHTFTWTSTNGACSNNDQMVFNSAGPGCATYCTPTFGTGVFSITNVTFAGINNTTATYSNDPAGPQYEDFTGGTCASVIQGGTYPLTISATGLGTLNTFYVTAFFDWNGDGDFADADEEQQIGSYANNSYTFAPFDITIPCDALVGTLRFRVMTHFNAYGTECISSAYGQAEDYCITIAADPTPNAVATSVYAPCATSATLDASTSTGLSGFWSLISGSGTITDANDPTTTITGLLNGSTTLQWTATSNCNTDTDQTTFIVSGLPDAPISAGTDQYGCFTSTSLEGSNAAPYTGTWTVSGPGGWSLSNANDPNATISGLVSGTYTLTWTIATGGCGNITDQMVINVGSVPPAEAGPAQTLCPESAFMAADLPAGFSGTWTQTGGPAATISDPNNPNTLIYNMSTGGGQTYTFQWEISGGGCPGTTTDLVTITMNTCTNPAPLSTSGAVTYTGCNYQFTDDGGTGGNYSNNVQQTNMVTFCPDDPNDFAELELTFLNLAPGDFFHVYDSPSPAAPIIAYASSAGLFTDPTPNNPSPEALPYTITSSTGCLYITFFSNSSTTDPGWEANISCSSTAGTQNQLFVSGLQCGGGGGITVCDSDNNEPYPTENTNAGSPQDIGNGFGPGTHGCIADGEGNSQWVYMAVDDAPGSGGTIAFEFSPAGGQDFDYALWGPYQGGFACPGYTGDAPIRCSWALNAESFCPWGSEATVGLSPTSPVSSEEPTVDPTDVYEEGTCAEPSQGYDDPQDGWLYPIDAQPGEVYVMVVQNYAQNAANWTFTWTGTATLNCAPAIGLGIELLSFEGERVGRENKLYWHTASEEDNAYFTIERSRDGINWEVLTIVTGAGTTVEQNVYEATDRDPFPGITYYRLEQTDFDGSTTMSRVVPISSELEDDLFGSIFPNPGSGSFYFLYGGKDFNNPVNVSVIDNAGKVISTNAHVGFNKSQGIQIDLDGYPAGIYQVIIEQNGEREVQKLTLIK